MSNVIYGGGEQVLTNLAQYKKREVEIFFLRKSEKILHLSNIRYISNFKAKHHYTSLIDHIINFCLSLKIFFLFKKKNDFDKISFIFHGFPFQFIIFFFKKINKLNKVHFVYHQNKFKKRFLNKIFCFFEKKLLLKKNIFIYGVSRYSIKTLNEYLDINNIHLFINSYKKIEPLKKYPFNLIDIFNRPYFLYVARFQKSKNHKKIIDLFLKNKSQLKNYNFVFIGDGPELLNINELIKLNKINNFITLGSIDRLNLYPIYLNSLAVLFPSQNESFGISILEALQFKKLVFVWNDDLIRNVNIYKINKLFDYLNNNISFIEDGFLFPTAKDTYESII